MGHFLVLANLYEIESRSVTIFGHFGPKTHFFLPAPYLPQNHRNQFSFSLGGDGRSQWQDQV